ncbi:hypothetical protein KIPB_007520 [Kipferlia bialata]|uniref:Uncharacterized protein n=1 Tax=Kipferlia bialata TaxID=797122 RepID=A0A391NN17_9EUKA|nr:hypothetical protein KIPB_007520 [Kipferlia bialata]|eukprot:g7520.t1
MAQDRDQRVTLEKAVSTSIASLTTRVTQGLQRMEQSLVKKPLRPTFDRPVSHIHLEIGMSTTETFTLTVPPAMMTFDLLVKGNVIVKLFGTQMIEHRGDGGFLISLCRTKDRIMAIGSRNGGGSSVTSTTQFPLDQTAVIPVQVVAYFPNVSVTVCNVNTNFA